MCAAAGVCDQHVPAARAADDSAHVDARGGGGARHAAGRVAAALADAEVPLQSGGRVLPVDARYFDTSGSILNDTPPNAYIIFDSNSVAQLLPLLRLVRQLPPLSARVLLLRRRAVSRAPARAEPLQPLPHASHSRLNFPPFVPLSLFVFKLRM